MTHAKNCSSTLIAFLLLATLTIGGGCFNITVPQSHNSDENMTLAPSAPVSGPAWWGFGRDPQHSAVSAIATQPLTSVHWSSAIDLAPAYVDTHLLIHYGSPVVTSMNTVIVPVKTRRDGGFAIQARAGGNGVVLWSTLTDYVPPTTSWIPSYNIALTSTNRLYAPGAGGKLIVRDNPDAVSGTFQSILFYGSSVYDAAKATFDSNIIINTPLTVDANGNVFFGFLANGSNPASLKSGIARVSSDGVGTWVSASVAAGEETITQVAMNCAPALSADSKVVYVAMNTTPSTNPAVHQSGSLVALDANTLATIKSVPLKDPKTGDSAWVPDSGTASPTVGPDGDVYYGVLESNTPAHNFRGWLLHFNKDLTELKTPGSFGWDITPSVLPASMVPSYTGTSTYLLMTKYNNYAGKGSAGDGKNRVAILDPHDIQSDAIAAIPVMKEVASILGQTDDPDHAGGVKEWCINTIAVDPFTKSVLVNNEDGFLYRWDLATNTLKERILLSSGIGEAYTPTAIGADGAVYAINNAVLFSIGQ